MDTLPIAKLLVPIVIAEHVVSGGGEPLVALEGVAAALGLDATEQVLWLGQDPDRWGLVVLGADRRGIQPGCPVTALPLRNVAEWLASFDPSQVRAWAADWIVGLQAGEWSVVAPAFCLGEQLIRDVRILAADVRRRAAAWTEVEARLAARHEAIGQQLAEVDTELAVLDEIAALVEARADTDGAPSVGPMDQGATK